KQQGLLTESGARGLPPGLTWNKQPTHVHTHPHTHTPTHTPTHTTQMTTNKKKEALQMCSVNTGLKPSESGCACVCVCVGVMLRDTLKRSLEKNVFKTIQIIG